MSKKGQRESDVDRRDFLKLVGVAGATAGAMPLSGAASAAETATTGHPTHHANAAVGARAAGASGGYEFLNVDESAFIEAAVDTLIPSDAIGPGAAELGVANYIDRQMASGYGKGDRLYLEGPFGEGTPQQGYQLPLTPAELMRAGIADVNAHVKEKYETTFDGLPLDLRIAVVSDLEGQKVDLPTVPTATFFSLLLQLTVEGFFADPMYGGNKNKGAWKMIGFPGADAMYMDKIEPFRNRAYTAEPKGIRDLV